MIGNLTWAERIETDLGDPVNPPPDVTREDGTVVASFCDEQRWDIDYVLPDGRRGGFAIIRDDLPWGKRYVLRPPDRGDAVSIYTHHGTDTVGFDLRGERLFLRSEREQNLRWLLFRARKAREDAA